MGKTGIEKTNLECQFAAKFLKWLKMFGAAGASELLQWILHADSNSRIFWKRPVEVSFILLPTLFFTYLKKPLILK